MLLHVISQASAWAVCLWAYSASFIIIERALGWTLWRVWRFLFHELKPFYLPAVFIGYVCDSIADGKPVGAARIIVLVVNVAGYWLCKNADHDDDDRWKRRRRKLREAVTVSGGKLVVVPAGGHS